MDRGQRHIYTPVKHLKWNFFAKILKAVNYYTPSWMYNWIRNTPLEGFIQDAPREELAIAPIAESFTTST